MPRCSLTALTGLTALALAFAGAAGCTEPRSDGCKEVCRREAECVEETESTMAFDEKECVAACAALEHDATVNAAKVQRHIACVQRQTTCTGVLECK